MEQNKTAGSKPKELKWIRRHPWITLGTILVSLVLLFNLTNQSVSNTTSQVTAPVTTCSNFQNSQAKKISFATLNKDPDSFNGTDAEFTGQIVQIQESDGQGVIRLDVTKEDYGWSGSDIIFVTYTGSNNFVENDVVTVYGVLQGSYTYTSQANFKITLPSMVACSIEKPSTQKVSQTSTSALTSTDNNTTPTTITTPSAPVVPKTWHTVATYSTSSSTQTAPFTMQGSEWRISYTCSVVDTTEGSGGFNGSIDNASDGSVANFFAEDVTTCPTSNTSYAYAQTPGQYYLDIGPFNVLVGVTVEDYY